MNWLEASKPVVALCVCACSCSDWRRGGISKLVNNVDSRWMVILFTQTLQFPICHAFLTISSSECSTGRLHARQRWHLTIAALHLVVTIIIDGSKASKITSNCHHALDNADPFLIAIFAKLQRDLCSAGQLRRVQPSAWSSTRDSSGESPWDPPWESLPTPMRYIVNRLSDQLQLPDTARWFDSWVKCLGPRL